MQTAGRPALQLLTADGDYKVLLRTLQDNQFFSFCLRNGLLKLEQRLDSVNRPFIFQLSQCLLEWCKQYDVPPGPDTSKRVSIPETIWVALRRIGPEIQQHQPCVAMSEISETSSNGRVYGRFGPRTYPLWVCTLALLLEELRRTTIQLNRLDRQSKPTSSRSTTTTGLFTTVMGCMEALNSFLAGVTEEDKHEEEHILSMYDLFKRLFMRTEVGLSDYLSLRLADGFKHPEAFSAPQAETDAAWTAETKSGEDLEQSDVEQEAQREEDHSLLEESVLPPDLCIALRVEGARHWYYPNLSSSASRHGYRSDMEMTTFGQRSFEGCSNALRKVYIATSTVKQCLWASFVKLSVVMLYVVLRTRSPPRFPPTVLALIKDVFCVEDIAYCRMLKEGLRLLLLLGLLR
ncbi:hypothetical protein CALCODRAFT_506171 [Calocera cornea HHB12733]|uniref:Uncharacterized protein n=1 Tax=Calocera cornea HHB12733 TaxID=1353952 RepID=A0A165JBC4_9BASI|nr:hypothetical protein CALCODRAFT_506171 [Calocera cornea HHB12733]